MDKITEKIKSYLTEHNLIDKKIIVAFSGGFDSMCLLDVLYKLGTNVAAAHLNHNWRGDESLADEKLCEKFCLEHNIEYYTETLSDDVEKTETAARKARYEFLERTAEKFNCKCVMTAHNADDNAETVLYRIIKGTGTYGLEGIKDIRGIFYRPLLEIYRHDIEEYCRQNDLHPCHDSSNDNTKYKRNLIRHEILPLMETINKDVKQALNSLSGIAKDENHILENLLPDLNNLSTDSFMKYNSALQSRIIHKFLRSNGIDYDKAKIDLLVDFITQNSASKSGITTSLTINSWLFVNNKKIYIVKNTESQFNSIEIPKCGQYDIAGKVFTIEKNNTLPEKFPSDAECIAYVDLSKIDFPLTLRNRMDGDFISPLGVDGKQKLKKYLNNKKIPKHKKDKLIFLCKGQEILWAAGLGISKNIMVTDKPSHILRLTEK